MTSVDPFGFISSRLVFCEVDCGRRGVGETRMVTDSFVVRRSLRTDKVKAIDVDPVVTAIFVGRWAIANVLAWHRPA